MQNKASAAEGSPKLPSTRHWLRDALHLIKLESLDIGAQQMSRNCDGLAIVKSVNPMAQHQ